MKKSSFRNTVETPTAGTTAPTRRRARLAARSALAGGLTVWAAASALAQAQPDAAKPKPPAEHKSEATSLETITVTAEKVAAPEQKTPIAMSVYGAEALAVQGVSDMRSLAAVAPDINFAAGGAAMPILTVRGMSSRDTTEIGDPAVSVSVDGIYSNRPYALNASMYDLDRIEVLRGPQGTLYGRNATGGALNIVTAAPDGIFGGYGSLDIGNYATRNIEAAINIPLSKTIQMRAATTSRYHDGYTRNGGPNDANDEGSRSARLSFAFAPTAAFKARVTVQSTQLRGMGQQSLLVPFVKNAAGQVVHTGIQVPGDYRTFPINPLLAYLHADENLVRWQASYALGPVDLTYIGGYNKIDYHHGDDQSNGTLVKGFLQNEDPRTQNHELRIASSPGGRLNWQAGLFHFQEDSKIYTYNATIGTTGSVLRLLTFDYAVKTKSDAVFGQMGYKLTDALKLTVGVRNSRDDKSRSGFIMPNKGTTPPISYGSTPSNASGSWNKSTYHLGVDWDLSPQTMLYAKYDTSYKAGGFTDIAPYGPESVQGPEVGFKTRMLGNKVQLNASLFDYDYTGQQVSQYVTGPLGNVSTQIVNAGKTKIYGGEADLTALAGALGRVTASIGYLHARFTDFATPLNGVMTQLAGNRPPQSPTLKFGLGWQKSIGLGSGSLTPRLDVHYTSAENFTFWNWPTDYQKAFTLTDVSATYAPEDGKWNLQFYLRNAGNTRVYAAAEDVPFSNAYRFAFGAPRTFGAKLTAYW